MNEIFRKFGISEKTTKQMIEMCPEVEELNTEEIISKVDILKDLNCDDFQIRNIISSNAFYLTRLDTDIHKLINKMEELGFDSLNLMFEGNPNILNLDDFEIETYVKKREKNGELLEDIIDDLESNLYKFEEI